MTHYENIEYASENGKKNILKYFDRIHDKLFTFNNIMIGGFFALSKINEVISIVNILFPVCNLIILIFIEYRMMELSRAESYIKETPIDEIESKLFSRYGTVTLLSLLAIITTFVVTFIFLYFLIWF